MQRSQVARAVGVNASATFTKAAEAAYVMPLQRPSSNLASPFTGRARNVAPILRHTKRADRQGAYNVGSIQQFIC
ncbi:MAG: hypothetical protein WCK70_12815 [Chloroflexales bacterium]